MVGRDMTHRFPPREAHIGRGRCSRSGTGRSPTRSTPTGWSSTTSASTCARGEVVGIAGLMGAGRTEFAMSVFGRSWGHFVSGQVLKDGKEVDVSTIPKAVDHGIAYATEDRKTYGLVLMNDVKTNITLANLEGVSSSGVLSRAQGDHGRQRVPRRAQHQDAERQADRGQPLGRQPAEGRPGQVAVRQPGRADPRRAHPRHRRRCQVRDLHDHQPPGGRGEGRHRHLVRASRRCSGSRTAIYVMAAGRIAAEMPASEATQESVMKAIMRLARAGAEEVVL